MKHPIQAQPTLERGVYQAPVFGPNGETIYFSVNRNHRIVRRELVSDPDTAQDVIVGLERELEDVDPPVQLRLVS